MLKNLGSLLLDNIRSKDAVIRYGGEEFMVCLPDTGLNEAEQVAEKLRVLVEQSHLSSNEKIDVTASFGVATLTEQETLKDTIARADAALYISKNSGRNRVSVNNDKAS